MVTRRYLEKKSTVLGLPMQEVGLLVLGMVVLGMVVLGMVVLIIAGSLLKLFAPGFRWFNHLTVVLIAGGYFLLRYASAQRHPSYLLSLISYRVLQRRRYYKPTVFRVQVHR